MLEVAFIMKASGYYGNSRDIQRGSRYVPDRGVPLSLSLSLTAVQGVPNFKSEDTVLARKHSIESN